MARNKYVKDYRIVETIDERGRIKADYEYIGEPYRYKNPVEAAKAEKTALGLDVLSLALFLAALLVRSRGSRTLYVVLPFAFSVLPLAMLADLTVSVIRAKKPMEHRFADKLDNSYPPICLGAMALAGMSFIAQLISIAVSRSGLMAGDLVFTLAAAGITAAMKKAFSLRDVFATEKAEK